MKQQLKGLIWLILAIGVGAAFAVGLPFLAKVIPWSVEKRAAVFLSPFPKEVCAESGSSPARQSFNRIVQRLYPVYPDDRSMPLAIEVIRGQTVNAFATLGGHVYVYDGLLQKAESPEELAGVLAHEIEHLRRRHILQTLLVRLSTVEALQFIFTQGKGMGTEITRLILNTRFTREEEQEADEGGLQRLHDARIDTAGFARFFDRAASEPSTFPTFLSDHPGSEDRAALARQYQTGHTEPLLTPAEWANVKTICR